jgi:alpha-beta hydrolase superfamily lysophospholipase
MRSSVAILLACSVGNACASTGVAQKQQRDAFLDQTAVTAYLLRPSSERDLPVPEGVRKVEVRIDKRVRLAGRLHVAKPDSPLLLYFYGNGEIAQNYDSFARYYTQLGLSMLIFDYRGYGASTGKPSGSALLRDATAVFDKLPKLCKAEKLAPKQTFVMGRSLGSAVAIEVASHAGRKIDGLILDSAFADTMRLLKTLGCRNKVLAGKSEKKHGFDNAAKLRKVRCPTLLIHGDSDRIIPVAEARKLFEASDAPESAKRLLVIEAAGHNTLLRLGAKDYFAAIEKLVTDVRGS